MKLINNIIFVFILLASNVAAQSFLKQEISVVEFNTTWNENNHYKSLNKLKNCNSYNISLCEKPGYMADFDILQPVIIVFHNGKDVKRYKANILLQFDINNKALQADIDSLLLLKFN
jgi:hypothetical protein|tara:strand:+ start:65 stop:415 length:351 start_codon:yes stop_codon:yes gene_type:complete